MLLSARVNYLRVSVSGVLFSFFLFYQNRVHGPVYMGTALNDQPSSGVAAGDVTGLWPKGSHLRCPRIAQVRRVGRLEPKLHSLGVAGQFGHVVELAENARRGRRACQLDRASPSPRGYGECPARTSRPWEPLSATASEGL